MRKNYQTETFHDHMKGMLQGFLFIMAIVIVIIFFQLLGYIDEQINGPQDTLLVEEDEMWNNEFGRSEGIRDKMKIIDKDNPMYEKYRSDFGSKSLNEKDRDEKAKAKKDNLKKSFKGF